MTKVAAKQKESERESELAVFHMKIMTGILWYIITSSTSVSKQFVIIPKAKPNLKHSEVDAVLER